MNSENNNHIIIEVINNDGDIKLTKMRNPRAIWFDSNMPDDYVFADVDYINIFSLIQENKQLKEENEELKRTCELFSNSLWSGDLKRAEERIDKAIEILENIPQIPNNYLELKRNDLLEILKGDSNE